MTVPLDVAALAADDEDDRVVVARVRDAPRRRRAAVEEAALVELARLAADVDPDAPPVHEVELVLRVVEVLGPFVAGGIDDGVDAERLDPERLPDLAEAVAVAELVEGGERVASRGARLRGVRERQATEELGELLALLRREPRAEQLLDVGDVRLARLFDLLHAGLREHGVRHARVGVAALLARRAHTTRARRAGA